ncbi:MAG: hypothetical protein PHU80_03290 [Kiritimatiellae bacterium]|nr:hypothetical protein [Kiritimatiellia bacterium]
MFVGCSARRSPLAWRLDVREDARGNRMFFSKRKRPGAERVRSRLFHYIAAGGMRQLRRTSADDMIEFRRRNFLIFLALMCVIWVVFYLMPSV